MAHADAPLDQLPDWCARCLGSPPAEVLFRTGHLSMVVGVRLSDGREVVVKARPPAERIASCLRVQAHLAAGGYPAPRPIAGPAPFGQSTATAEDHMPAGSPLAANTPEQIIACARALADLVAAAPAAADVPSLDPPPWAWPQHPGPGVWPAPDDLDGDLNGRPGPVPGWLDDLGRRIRRRLGHRAGPLGVGHVDWEAQNLRWDGDGRLVAVHDWDSAATQTEPVIAGLAAAVHTATGLPGTEATTAQAAQFLDAYQHARRNAFDPDELRDAWAAGLCVRAFNTAKDTFRPTGASDSLALLATHADERRHLAGL